MLFADNKTKDELAISRFLDESLNSSNDESDFANEGVTCKGLHTKNWFFLVV